MLVQGTPYTAGKALTALLACQSQAQRDYCPHSDSVLARTDHTRVCM